MKKIIWMMAMTMCLVAAGCSKSNDSDEFAFEREYAEGDFRMTAGNIREKLIGVWDVEDFSLDNWQHLKKEDLPEVMQTAVFRPDGTGEFLGLEGVHWSVDENMCVVIETAYLYAYDKDGNRLGGTQMGNGMIGAPREYAEQHLWENYPNAVSLKDVLTKDIFMNVKNMTMKRFEFDANNKYSMIKLKCTLVRR